MLVRSSGAVWASNRSMRAISTVSMPQRVASPAAGSAACIRSERADDERRVGTREAATEDECSVVARLLLGFSDAHALALGIGLLQRCHAGNDTIPQAAKRQDGLDDACTGDQVSDRPLERGGRRRIAAEDVADRGSFGSIGLRRAVAVGDDHAYVRRCEPRAVERLANRSLEPVAIVAYREQADRLRGVAAAEHLADHLGAALLRRALGFQREGSRALAEDAAAAPRVERSDRVLRQQSALVVVEHHLRLDESVMANGNRTVGLALAQRLRRLDHRQRAAAAVIGDAGVRAL